MDNNDNSGGTWGGGPNAQGSQPMGQPMPEQPIGQPMGQMTGQPVMNQPMGQPMTTPLADQFPLDTDGTKRSKNLLLIVAFILIGLVVGGAIILVAFFLRGSGEITLSCFEQQTRSGLTQNQEVDFKIKDGTVLSGKVTYTVDLKNMSEIAKNMEKELVDSATSRTKEECNENCTFEYEYIEGDYLKTILSFNEEGVQDKLLFYVGYDKLSAQEIADRVQKSLEDDDMTCKQY